MAAEKKIPNKKSGGSSLVNCDKIYVYNHCSRTVVPAQQDSGSESTATSTMSSDMSPDSSPVHSQIVSCRHQRKGAVREKRSASQYNQLKKSDRQPADGKSAADMNNEKKAGTLPVESVDVVHNNPKICGTKSVINKPTMVVKDDKGQLDRPFIDFASVSEELMMTPIWPSADMLDDGIEEFPAYVPWRATYKWSENTTSEDGVVVTMADTKGPSSHDENSGGDAVTMCQVCRKCRCVACQQNCKYPKTTVCNVEVSSNAFMDALAFLPCVKKTARCIEYVRDRSTTEENAWFENPCTKQRYARPPKKWQICGFLFLCFPCFGPYYPLRCVMQCSDQCYGNLTVPGCKCVDWDALRHSRRFRSAENPYYSALSSSVAERRRRYQNQLTAENAAAAAAKATAAKAKSAKAEAAKAKAVKAEATNAEGAKTEGAKTEAVKAEAAKAEAIKFKAAKVEIAKAELVEAKPTKAETAKAELVQVEQAKFEVSKSELDQTDLDKAELSIDKVAKAELDKSEVVETNTSKVKDSKVESTIIDAKKANAIETYTDENDATITKSAKTVPTKIKAVKPNSTKTKLTTITIPTMSANLRSKLNNTRITSNAAIATFADAYRITAVAATANTSATTEIAKIDKTTTKSMKTTVAE